MSHSADMDGFSDWEDRYLTREEYIRHWRREVVRRRFALGVLALITAGILSSLLLELTGVVP